MLARRDTRLVEKSSLFWAGWYAETYGIDVHDFRALAAEYVLNGAHKGHWPSAHFNPSLYLLANPDVAESGIPPFVHYLRHGEAEERPLAPPSSEAASLSEIVAVGVIEGGLIASKIAPAEAERLIQEAKAQSLEAVCLSTPADIGGIAAMSWVSSAFMAAGLRVCVRFIESAHEAGSLGPEACHGIASALSEPNYFRCGGRPLVIVSSINLLREGLLLKLDHFLAEYRIRRPLYAVEAPIGGFGSNPANLLWFDAVAESFGDIGRPEFAALEATPEPSVSYAAILRSVNNIIPSDDSPRLPALMFPWSSHSPLGEYVGPVSHYSKDILLNWARHCAGVAMGSMCPGPILVRHWNSSAGGIDPGDARNAFKAIRKFVLDWTILAKQEGSPFNQANLADNPDQKPVIVFQMGKVGSTSIHEPLAESYRLGPVFHTHTLCGIDTVLANMRRRGSQDRATIDRLREWDQLHKAIENSPAEIQWRIITLVREPVARILSFFLHELAESRPNFRADWESGDLSAEELRELFFQFAIEASAGADNWWNTQFLPLTGIDVFQTEFPYRLGYSSCASDRFRVLLLRTEDLNRIGSAAISQFLEAPFEFKGEKLTAETRGLSEIRNAILSRPLPREIVDRLHSTKTAHHFYSEAELEASKKNWIQSDKCDIPGMASKAMLH